MNQVYKKPFSCSASTTLEKKGGEKSCCVFRQKNLKENKKEREGRGREREVADQYGVVFVVVFVGVLTLKLSVV